MDERDQFELHIMRHLDSAYNLARWYVSNPQDAEDVVQESMLKAFKAFRKFKGANPKAWLLQIVRNDCLRCLEKGKAFRIGSLEDEPAGFEPVAADSDPEALLIQMADADAVRIAVAALPPLYREALVLREFEQMGYSEISIVASVPLGTVMSRLSRARSMLADSLRKSNLEVGR